MLAGPVALVFSAEFMPHEYNVNKLLLDASFHPDGGDTHALELEYSKPCKWVVTIENASYQAADMACGAISAAWMRSRLIIAYTLSAICLIKLLGKKKNYFLENLEKINLYFPFQRSLTTESGLY